ITLIVSLIRTSLKSISLLTPDSDYALTVGANAVLSGLIGTIVSGTFLTQGFTWPIYILAALTVVVSRIVQSDCQNEKKPNIELGFLGMIRGIELTTNRTGGHFHQIHFSPRHA
ncbi:hypothetical protein OFN61_27870, partial [Escherichia coli]|nr:hypothetical protein [Escherichia coli]